MTGVKPRTSADVLAAVKWAADGGRTLDVVAGGSKRGFGRPVVADEVLDLSALTGVDRYEPEELVLNAAPATPLEEIEQLLAQQGQMLAFEPPAFGAIYGIDDPRLQTIGGIVACNLSGPRRIKAGAVRDHVLGFSAVSGRGEEFKSGGRVVKNVTGYDLSKLITGSFGTLAVMTDLTLKVMPAPEKLRTVLVFGLGERDAVSLLAEAAGSPHEVSGLAHLPGEVAARSSVGYVNGAGGAVTAIRVEGVAPSVEHRCAALKESFARRGPVEELHSMNTGQLWREIRDVASLLPDREKALWRISVPPTTGPHIAAQLRDQPGVECLFDWCGGLLWLTIDVGEDAGFSSVNAAVADNGHATLVRAPDEVRARVPVFQPQAPALAALSARVKAAFDPTGILNPGRMTAD
jgi:glycolate oxidase FAD binding subunit